MLLHAVGHANDSSFLIHVDDKSETKLEDSSNLVDWDAVDSGMKKKSENKFES